MQRQFRLGGGVSPRGTLLRGQSIIEHVLVIAVIGLVIVFAGPGVAGAIRNQFNLVGNTVNSGMTGGIEGGLVRRSLRRGRFRDRPGCHRRGRGGLDVG